MKFSYLTLSTVGLNILDFLGQKGSIIPNMGRKACSELANESPGKIKTKYEFWIWEDNERLPQTKFSSTSEWKKKKNHCFKIGIQVSWYMP